MATGSRFREFGRKIFSMFDSHPTLMNSIVGGLVYASSEAVVQYKTSKEPRLIEKFDKTGIIELGALGSLENGFLMTTWLHLSNINIS